MQEPVFLICFDGEPSPSDRERFHLKGSVPGPGGRPLWMSYGWPADLVRLLFDALLGEGVRSAAFLPGIPPEELRWLATEWRGALVTHLDLADLLGVASESQWHWAHTDENQRIAVLRPQQERPEVEQKTPPVRVLEGTATAYREELFSNVPAVARVRLSEVRQDLSSWFGDLAEPDVGGAIALLTLSGARKDSDSLVLRNPAALGLVCEYPEHSLAAYRRDAGLQVSGVGTTMREAPRHVVELRASSEEWAHELDRLSGADCAADYVALLELSALRDPEIVIGEGTVLEQTGITGAQTLSVARPRSVTVSIDEIIPVALPAWCLNASLNAPNGEPIRPTPLRFSEGSTQREVWDTLSDLLKGSQA
ncbi:hypothetical protein [Streptomyces diastatochromogenes]|uniref:hypothetical protein n=1 Tax=Streptomyces diastatochromogenes TaxID=42236 RepID=UPI00117F981F|nr:hypothetical protein [Streptomyces diastatochromogenes]MCZ0990375.1 hypothetical protein [Streptomyces diastatochromogenes]